MSDVHHIVVPVANPSRSNPQGLAVSGHYIVRDGSVLICTEGGTPTGAKAKLKDGDNARVIAARLLKRQWEDAAESDFNRPLGHGDYERWPFVV